MTIPEGLLQAIAATALKVAVIALVAWVLLGLVGRVVQRIVLARLHGASESGETLTAEDEATRKRLTTVTSLIDWLFRLLIVGGALVAILLVLGLDIVIVAMLALVALVYVVAQDVVRDYVGGVLVILENQFAIGDVVRIAGEAGEVEAVSLRRTLLRTPSGDLVTVPNGELRIVTNRTSTWGRINLDIGIADPADIDAARLAIDEAGRALAADPELGPSVLEAPRLVSVSDITDRGVRLIVQGKVDARARFVAEATFRERLLRALSGAGVAIVTAARMQVLTVEPPPMASDGSRDGSPAAEAPRS